MAESSREFHMSDAHYKEISELAYKYTGIVLAEHKKDMVYGRLARRMRSLGLQDMKDYVPLIQMDSQAEVSSFINAITTNLTSFFREKHHFDFLANEFCKEVRANHQRRIRGWSSACSTGEEAYSIALTLKENLPQAGFDCKILATDLDSKVLEHGSAGVYEKERVKPLTMDQKKAWLLADRRQPDVVKVKPALQDMIKFKRLNLIEKWPMKGPFDFIFCRNVFIYFDLETQQKILNGFAQMLRPGGYLFIGHSENLHDAAKHFDSLGKTVYQRK